MIVMTDDVLSVIFEFGVLVLCDVASERRGAVRNLNSNFGLAAALSFFFSFFSDCPSPFCFFILNKKYSLTNCPFHYQLKNSTPWSDHRLDPGLFRHRPN